MQENNYIVIVDAKTATVVGGFEAGETGVAGVDTKNDGKIDFSGENKVVPREPDWVTALAAHCIDSWRRLGAAPSA